MPRFNLDDYIPVQERINEFWQEHPEGRIVTSLESDPADFTTCRYKATIYCSTAADPREPVATGWAFEIAGGNSANATSHEENCETSAIGRALANLGYATSHKTRPSREEMAKVERFADETGVQRPVPVAPVERKRMPLPVAIGDAPKGVYLMDGAGETIQVPSVSRQHGVNTMAQVTAFTSDNGFTSTRKGDLIEELERTYDVKIMSGRGTNQYGQPDVFPSEIYDVAQYLMIDDEAAV